MIVSMGCGSFYARRLKDSFLSFAWLEVSGAVGSTVILLIAAPSGLAMNYLSNLRNIMVLPVTF